MGVVTSDIRLTSRQIRRERAHFERVRNAEVSYAVQLRKIARHIGELVKRIFTGHSTSVSETVSVLNQYSNVIRPWAIAVSRRMLAEVSRRDASAWFNTSKELGIALRNEIRNAPTGAVMRRLHEDQVNLITSLPVEAAQRVQKIAQEHVEGGRRYDDMLKDIMDTGNVTLSRATLIARTETAKAQAALMQARALHIGSEGYTWRAVMDYRTRPMHRKLNGTFHRWNDPPIAETNGERHHPGCYPNCRCYAIPLLPDRI